MPNHRVFKSFAEATADCNDYGRLKTKNFDKGEAKRQQQRDRALKKLRHSERPSQIAKKEAKSNTPVCTTNPNRIPK